MKRSAPGRTHGGKSPRPGGVDRTRRGVWLAMAAPFWSAFAIDRCLAQRLVPAPGGTNEALDASRLKGAWKRPDGSYIIVIRNVGPAGELTAMYFNPNPLPFASAHASQVGGALRATFELQAGGYNGSTYRLSYDPASDRLVGTYYQAVAKQNFEVYFVRQAIEGAAR